MEQRVSVITLGVEDIARARAFYAKLGWKEGPGSQEAVVFYQLGGMVLALFGRAALAEDAHVMDSTPAFSGISLAYNVRSRGEADYVLAEAERAGARIIKPAQEVFWGGYSGYFADPDGHLWEVAHNPFWTIDENGGIHLDEID